MKRIQRMLSVLLSLCMLLSLMPAGVFASEKKSADADKADIIAQDVPSEVTGSITATLELTYEQKMDALKERKIQVELFHGGAHLIKVGLLKNETHPFDINSIGDQSGSKVSTVNAAANRMGTATVTLLDSAKKPVTGDEFPNYLKVAFSGLPKGTYKLKFTGEGYKTYEPVVELTTHAKELFFSTGDASFSIGDLNSDGKVDTDDCDDLSKHLGSSDSTYDLNGDGRVNIQDLAYVHRLSDATEMAKIRDSYLLDPPVVLDSAKVETDLEEAGTKISERSTGTMQDLFRDNNKTVSFAKTSENKEDSINIPITMEEPVKMEEVVIVTPEGDGQIQNGSLEVETEKDGILKIPFGDSDIPEGVHAISELPGKGSISVKLGKKVAVKKITIKVTKTEGGDYASVENIQFLEDIVPENTENQNRRVMDLRATPGAESVTLTWSALPNVTGYRIDYFEVANPDKTKRKIKTEKTTYRIEDLENLREYEFTVTPLADGWEGLASNAVRVQPEPGSVPDAPDRVNIVALDKELDVSWTGKNATMYQVWYKEHDSDKEFKQYGDTLHVTNLRMTGLTNGVTYDIKLKAGNKVGWGSFSAVYSKAPEGVEGKEPKNMPTEGLLDNDEIEKIWLSDPGNSLNGRLDNASILIDSNYGTSWTAKSWSGDEHVYVKFKNPQDLTAALWVPRLDGNYSASLRAYCVRVWYEGDDLNEGGHLLLPDPARGGLDSRKGSGGSDVHTWPNCPNYGTKSAEDGFVYMPFGPVKGVKQICVACEQKNYEIVSMSELKFMTYDPERSLPDEIAALFTTGFHDKLNSSVTSEQIKKLKDRLDSDEKNYYINIETMKDELALAEELLAEKTGSSVFVDGLESRSAGNDNTEYSQSGSELQPLGATAKAKSEITVYAEGIPEGEKLTLYATQFNGEVTAWQKSVELTNGRNIIYIPKIGERSTDNGGSLYVSYSGANPETIKLHVRRAVEIPTLKLENWYSLGKSEREKVIGTYLDELDSYIKEHKTVTGNDKEFDYHNVTELSLPRVLLSIPASAVQEGLVKADADGRTETLYNAVLAWEELVRVCEATQGIIEPDKANDDKCAPVMETRQNIRCMTMFTGAFMYAAGNHIGIGYSSCEGMVTGKPTSVTGDKDANSLYGWGIAHEIGHNMDQLGKAECTNNIYSILAQTFDGAQGVLKSRMEQEKRWPEILNRTAQAYVGTASNVFTQLGMYYQLHLAYDTDNPLEFYNKFFKAWKAGTYTSGYSNATYDEQVALTAAGVANKNLNDFFHHWGMELSETVKNKIDKYENEERAIWYLTDESRRDALNKKSELTGSVTASATVNGENEKEVKIKITPSVESSGNSADIQGYEIIRNDKSVGFVLAGKDNNDAVEYTDMVGSANNRTFYYSVKAYDTLGNPIGDGAECDELRISYDNLVDENAYTTSEDGNNTVTLTLDKTTPISGIKVFDLPQGCKNRYEVKIKVDVDGVDAKDSVKTAKTGSFDKGNLNQDKDDKDTTYLTYFNKPGVDEEDTRIWTYDAKSVTVTGVPKDAKVRLVSYVNDDVTVEAVGKLAKDYEVGDGEVIKAGSLIAWGYYRGDPVFGGIRLKGKYSQNDTEKEKEIVTERAINGAAYLFADIPEDGEISTISDGIYLFVFDEDAEKNLIEEGVSNCDTVDVLPFQVKAEYFQTDDALHAEKQRVTAETLWVQTPGADHLPEIDLQSEVNEE